MIDSPSRHAIVVATILAMLCFAGCAAVPMPLAPIANPIPTLDEVSIVPVAARDLDESENWTRHLQSALLRVDGVDRIALRPPLDSDGAPSLAGHQAVLAIDVIEFDAYIPSASLEVALYVPNTSGAWDPLTMDRQGAAPVNDRFRTGTGPWIRFQKRYSVEDAEVMNALRRYALSLGDTDRGFTPEESVLKISDRFIDFVLYEALKDCFERIPHEHEDEQIH